MVRTILVFPLLLSLVTVSSGCDHEAPQPSSRSADAEFGDDSQSAEVGGGFVPDPDCAYDCEVLSAGESACAQRCEDGCATLVLRAEHRDDGSVSVTETQMTLCADSLPDPSLWDLTCDITYGAASEGMCEDQGFSADACAAAYDLCLGS
jgi:hypothetical protein